MRNRDLEAAISPILKRRGGEVWHVADLLREHGIACHVSTADWTGSPAQAHYEIC